METDPLGMDAPQITLHPGLELRKRFGGLLLGLSGGTSLYGCTRAGRCGPRVVLGAQPRFPHPCGGRGRSPDSLGRLRGLNEVICTCAVSFFLPNESELPREAIQPARGLFLSHLDPGKAGMASWRPSATYRRARLFPFQRDRQTANQSVCCSSGLQGFLGCLHGGVLGKVPEWEVNDGEQLLLAGGSALARRVLTFLQRL